MSTKMNFMNFRDKVMEDLTCRLHSKGYPVQLAVSTVLVNNGIQEEKIEVRCPGKDTGYYIPIRQFYSPEMDEEEYHVKIEEMTDGTIEKFLEKPDMKNDFKDAKKDFERRVFSRLISADLNKELLLRVPHRIIGQDLALVYRLMISFSEKEGLASSLIEKKDCNYTEEELYSIAVENTPRMFPEEFISLEEIFCGIRTADDKEDTLYVLSNKHNLNGATVVAYPGCLERVSRKMEDKYGTGDFYVLPCSIHEVLILSSRTNVSETNLIDMIREANHSSVDEREILSHSLYLYKKGTGTLHIVKFY